VLQDEVCWRPVVVSVNPLLRSSLLETLCSRMALPEDRVFSEYPKLHRILACAQANDANLCFIDISSDEEQALRLVRDLAMTRPLTVVALHTDMSADRMLRCVRSGVHEFLSEPWENGSVWSILDTLAGRLQSGPGRQGSVFVVLPSKPNLGSTTVATGLALRTPHKETPSVLLAELDPLYGSLGTHLRLKGAPTFLDAFSNWERLDSDLWSQLVVRFAGADILLAPEGSGTCDFAAPPALEFTHFARQRYSLSFLDCPGLLTDWYTQLAAAADGVLLVTSNEWLAIPTAQRCLQRLEAAGCDQEKVKLVINRYQPDSGIEKQALAEALRRTVFHTLPDDPNAAQQAVCDGKPVHSRSRLGKSLDELGTQLLGKPDHLKTRRSWPARFSRA
jgi:pilus assembly protein CpaE